MKELDDHIARSAAARQPRRRWRRVLVGLVALLLAWALMLFVLLLLPSNTSGGPAYPWSSIEFGTGQAIREAWAALTGQSINQDLFP
jgi:hypothetical protein